MGTASITPLPTGEPRNRAGKEIVGGARAPALGSFHLNSASCVCILSPPQSLVLGGCYTSKVSELVRLSDYLTQQHHCTTNGKTETRICTWSQSLTPNLFLKTLRSPLSRPTELLCSCPSACHAPAVSRQCCALATPAQASDPLAPTAAHSSYTFPRMPLRTSNLHLSYGNCPFPSPLFPGDCHHIQGLSPKAPAYPLNPHKLSWVLGSLLFK